MVAFVGDSANESAAALAIADIGMLMAASPNQVVRFHLWLNVYLSCARFTYLPVSIGAVLFPFLASPGDPYCRQRYAHESIAVDCSSGN
jgi:hypothetical protein